MRIMWFKLFSKQAPPVDYSDQLQRIQAKLVAAENVDKAFKVFGATNHRYQLAKPATEAEVVDFERTHAIRLPASYRLFITQISNGGAGPFLGIDQLGDNLHDMVHDLTGRHLANACVIHPKMTVDFWNEQRKRITDYEYKESSESDYHTQEDDDEDDDESDDYLDNAYDEDEPDDDEEEITEADYNQEFSRLYGGLLPIGSQGCTYAHALVLNGPYCGRVVNLDRSGQKPIFTFEPNFLDWYERWLDEIISGQLLDNGPHWFGYYKGGPEEGLLAGYFAATTMVDKEDCLYGLVRKKTLTEKTLDQVEALLEDKITPGGGWWRFCANPASNEPNHI